MFNLVSRGPQPSRIFCSDLVGLWLLKVHKKNKGQLKNGILKCPSLFAGHQVSSCYEEGSGIFDPIYGKGENGNDDRIISGPGQSLLC